MSDLWAKVKRYFQGQPKSNLVEHAERELAVIGLDDPENDFYHGMTRKAVMEIVTVFAKQGHSGMSASLVVGMVEKLLRYEPLAPLTGEESEWTQLDYDSHMAAQNKRCSHVFKRADGTAYDTNGRVFREPNGGSYTSRGSHVEITFPYTPSVEYVDVDEHGEPIEVTS